MSRTIPDNELRIGIGRWHGDITRAPVAGPWYVTLYTRDLRHDRAEGWYPTHAKAMEVAETLIPRVTDINAQRRAHRAAA